jgi:hypothetical protein
MLVESHSMKKYSFLLSSYFTLVFVLFAGTARAQLQGIIDEHAHSDPDNSPRRFDALELAREASSEGMRAIVLKNHQMPTTQLAYLVNQLVPGVKSWGSIVLNRSVGGINPDAVEQQATVKGHFLKIVFMPTLDAESPKSHAANKPYVAIAKDGVLLPQTVEVLKLILKYDLVLGTGHLQPADCLLLVGEAHKMGINRIVVTHPMVQGTTVAQMQEEARNGAYLGFPANQILPGEQNGSLTIVPNAANRKPEEWVADIHAIGAEHCILASDLGATGYPPDIDGWKLYLATLKKAGITDAEIDLMARENPAHLLGMDAPRSVK